MNLVIIRLLQGRLSRGQGALGSFEIRSRIIFLIRRGSGIDFGLCLLVGSNRFIPLRLKTLDGFDPLAITFFPSGKRTCRSSKFARKIRKLPAECLNFSRCGIRCCSRPRFSRNRGMLSCLCLTDRRTDSFPMRSNFGCSSNGLGRLEGLRARSKISTHLFHSTPS